jgi:predicted DNA-binding protein
MQFHLPEPLIERLAAYSRKTDMPMSEHVRAALQQYLMDRAVPEKAVETT